MCDFKSCVVCLNHKSKNWNCPNFYNCPYFENKYNVVINEFTPDYNEVIVYKKFFDIRPNPNLKDIDRSRKFYYDENGILRAKTDDVTIADLQDTMSSSRKRAQDNLWGYALCNKWRYFFTVTFDPNKVVFTVRDKVMYCWQKLRQKLQYYFPDIKILAVTENHKLGGIHLHGFIGDCVLTKFLRQGIDTKMYLYDYDYKLQQKIYKLDKYGNKIANKHYLLPMTHRIKVGDKNYTTPIFTFKDSFFSFGYTTLVELAENTNNAHITAYLCKYFTKDLNSNVMYAKKAYFHTQNLLFKYKKVLTLSEDELKDFVKDFKIKDGKDSDRFTIYTYTNDEWLNSRCFEEIDDGTDPYFIFNKFQQMNIKDLNTDDIF